MRTGLLFGILVMILLASCGGGGQKECQGGYYQNGSDCVLMSSPLVNNGSFWMTSSPGCQSGCGVWCFKIELYMGADGTGLNGTGYIQVSTEIGKAVTPVCAFNEAAIPITWTETDPSTILLSQNSTGIRELSNINPSAGSAVNPTSFTSSVVTESGTISESFTLETGAF